MNIEHKTIAAEIKQAGEDGSFEAVIATFDVIDSDNDIIEHGAFGGAFASVLPAHDQGSVPMGKVQVQERGNLAIAVGGFNLEIEKARDWSSALKFDLANPPSVQDWSWGFTIPEGGSKLDTIDGETVRIISKVDLFEVSPVLRAASVGTGTISAKSDNGEPPPLIDQIKLATGEVSKLIEAIQAVAARRKEKGRELGPDIRLATVEMAEETSKLLDQLAEAVKDEMPRHKNSAEEESERRQAAAKATALWLASGARRVGVEL